MNLAALQKFMPLVSLLGKQTGELTDVDLKGFAETLAGVEGSAPLYQTLVHLRDSEPATAVAEIFGSPTAQRLFETMSKETEMVENTAFIKCPVCGSLSEHELH